MSVSIAASAPPGVLGPESQWRHSRHENGMRTGPISGMAYGAIAKPQNGFGAVLWTHGPQRSAIHTALRPRIVIARYCEIATQVEFR